MFNPRKIYEDELAKHDREYLPEVETPWFDNLITNAERKPDSVKVVRQVILDEYISLSPAQLKKIKEKFIQRVQRDWSDSVTESSFMKSFIEDCETDYDWDAGTKPRYEKSRYQFCWKEHGRY
tara:strand:- start:143 stop:511 length:369 start_codon:yes stop_codon:yes gene_type:complete